MDELKQINYEHINFPSSRVSKMILSHTQRRVVLSRRIPNFPRHILHIFYFSASHVHMYIRCAELEYHQVENDTYFGIFMNFKNSHWDEMKYSFCRLRRSI